MKKKDIDVKAKLYENLDTIIAALFALLMYIIAARFARLDIDVHHDGILLKPAIDVLNGMVLFRDTFTQYGAFFTYFQAMAMAVFGVELLTIRLQTAFMYAVTAFFSYKCWRFFLPRGLAVISGFLFIGMSPFFVYVFYPWSSVASKALMAIIIFCLMKFIENKNHKYILLVGLFTAINFFTRQPVGIVAFAGTLFLLVCYHVFMEKENAGLKKIFANYLLGVFSVVLLYFLYLAVVGAFYDWYAQSIRYMFRFGTARADRHAQALAHGGPGFLNFFNFLFFHLFPRHQSAIWTAMPVVCILLFLNFCSDKIPLKEIFREKRLKLVNSASEKELYILTFVVLAIASWHQYFPVSCINHVYWAAGFMAGIFVYFFWEIINLKSIVKKSVCMGLVILFFFFADINHKIRTGIHRYNIPRVTIDYGFHLNGMRVSADEYNFFRVYFEFLEQLKEMLPERQFLNLTNCAFWGITFDVSLTNMTFYSGNVIYNNHTEDLRRIKETHRPIIISYTQIDVPFYTELASLGGILFFIHEEDLELLFGE